MKYPSHLLKLVEVLRRLPGVGVKSAERFAFDLLTWPKEQLSEMAGVIDTIHDRLKSCIDCGCLAENSDCRFCLDERAISGVLCIVASPRDVFAIEATGEYRGLYHVLGGTLSPLEGIGPEKLHIDSLKNRLSSLILQEVIIAIDSTLEGDATSLYLKQEIEPLGIRVSRLAFGLPIGSSIDYVDGGTLARAFAGRRHF